MLVASFGTAADLASRTAQLGVKGLVPVMGDVMSTGREE